MFLRKNLAQKFVFLEIVFYVSNGPKPQQIKKL